MAVTTTTTTTTTTTRTAPATTVSKTQAEYLDGNAACTHVAYRLSEVMAIYPITPASAMGEIADAWCAQGRANLWGTVPEVIEMQSEAGAAGALHGAIQKGTLGTTFTASQGLLLMLPNMFKIAGELTPSVIHVAARTIATHALSIFGDHSDVMAARTTGFAMLASASPQEAHDMAAVAHAATLRTRVPFLHFFDGFRTSHELNEVTPLTDDNLLALMDEDAILAHRQRRLRPDAPVLRGSAQNPDVFFQAREAANPYYDATPGIVTEVMDELAQLCGRHYDLVEYIGDPQAERVVVLMGSGCGAAEEAVAKLCERGERVGLCKIRLYRPFPADALCRVLPQTVTKLAVLDRTKEPGAVGEPLYQDVLTALAESERGPVPLVIAGRYGLSSKEFRPEHVAGLFAEMASDAPRRHVTLGITDDVTHLSVHAEPGFQTDSDQRKAVFYGLGSDGTVGATKATVEIIGAHTDLHAQGYFVYDSKKAGAMTVSHLRFGTEPITSTYLIDDADFVACHQFAFLDRVDVLRVASSGATFLLNSPYGPDEVWDQLPREVQETILDRHLELWVIDADAVARDVGMGGRINMIMQPCFFAISGVVDNELAISAIKDHVTKTYGKRGQQVVERNFAAIDAAIANLHRVSHPNELTSAAGMQSLVPKTAPEFVQRVTARIMAGEGDLLPVSAMPVDGTFPLDTARYEKRMIARDIPIWDPQICIDCAKCVIVCPHAAIRMKVYPASDTTLGTRLREIVPSKPFRSRELADHLLSIQVTPDDCTGCGVCVDVCPAHSKEDPTHKSLNMRPAIEHRDRERVRYEAFCEIPELSSSALHPATVKGSQVREPLFEFSGACAGCGETPYIKLLTQLFGDRIVVANATGCSSIYGGNLPTTPWSTNAAGRGPAWSNSLFEDNAEFGLGMLLGRECLADEAARLAAELKTVIDPELTDAILNYEVSLDSNGYPDDAAVVEQQARVTQLKNQLAAATNDADPRIARLLSICDELAPASTWIVGGDGWAYDIGSAGLDHVLASGRNVNVLVLDTEVYSNTGGQASKATPRAAVAKFASSGKQTAKKDLGMLAIQYGNVYVARVALGANDIQTVKAFIEADAWPGPSLIIAYSTCIAHGIDMATSMTHQKDAVNSGYWPLWRYHPGTAQGTEPFKLDSRKPKIPLADFTAEEGRFSVLTRQDPDRASALLQQAQEDVNERWEFYEQFAAIKRHVPVRSEAGGNGAGDDCADPTADGQEGTDA